MKLKSPVPLKEIAALINAKIIGDENALVTGINEIHKVIEGDITFVDVEKYYKKSLTSAASFIIINKEVECPEGKALLVLDEPFTGYNTLTQHFQPFEQIRAGSKNHSIGEGTIIEPNVVIGEHVKIGKNSHIRANVVLHSYTEVGDNVIIQSGTVVGTDAFYYKGGANGFEKWHACGRVIIENYVEIGALCTIDKGVSGDTIIGQGTKIDNHCHIGHGVVIGKNCLLAAQVGIAGKTHLKDGVILYGQVGVSKSLTIGEKAVISAQSGVSKSLEGGKAYFGSPAVPIRTHHKEKVALRGLPALIKRLEKILKDEA
jgi:UDP-3-O-[3-hydroxymyristoyl] glucosamine N-acyltransferase